MEACMHPKEVNILNTPLRACLLRPRLLHPSRSTVLRRHNINVHHLPITSHPLRVRL